METLYMRNMIVGQAGFVAFWGTAHKIIEIKEKGMEQTVSRKLIIDGNAVYEIDEECMLKNRLDKKEDEKSQDKEKTVNRAKDDTR